MEEKNVQNLFPETGKDTSSKLNTEGLDAEAPEAVPAEVDNAGGLPFDPQSDEEDSALEEGLFSEDRDPEKEFDESRRGFDENPGEERGEPEEGSFEEEDEFEEDEFEEGSAEEDEFGEEYEFEEEPFQETGNTDAGASASSASKKASFAASSSGKEVFSGSKKSDGTAVTSDPAASAGTAGSADHAAEKKEVENALEQLRGGKKKAAGKARAATYQEKILRHQKRRNRRTIFLVVLVTLLLSAAVILWMRRGYTQAELKRVSLLSVDDSAGYANIGGNVVQYGNNGAVCINRRGDTQWSVSYEMQQPVTSVSGNVIAIGNRGGYYVYVMNTEGLMGTIQTMLPIHNVAAAANGEVAVIMNDTKVTWVRLYTASGKEIANLVCTTEGNGYPVGAAVSPDGKTLCLASVRLSSDNVQSNVSFYNFGKEGKNTVDHLVGTPNSYDDEVFAYVYYIDDSTCVAVSDRRMVYFPKTRFPSSGSNHIMFTDNLQGVFPSDSFIGLLFADTKEESQYSLDIYNKRGKKAGTVKFSIPFSEIVIEGDKVYISNAQQCQIYTIGGRCLFDGGTDRTIRAMIPGASLSDLLVVTEGEIDSVRLH